MTYDPRKHGAQCDICPLKDQKPVQGEGPESATFAIVGEAPGRNEVRVGRPFIGASGVFLDKRLIEAKINRDDILITNAMCCMPPGGSLLDYRAELRRSNKAEKKRAKDAGKEPKLVLDPLDCCRPRLMKELDHVIAKARKKKITPVIVPAGAAALEVLMGKKMGIKKWRGSAIRWMRETETG